MTIGIKVPIYGRSIKEGDIVMRKGKPVLVGPKRQPCYMGERFGWDVFDIRPEDQAHGVTIEELPIYRDREYEVIQEVG